MASTMLTPIAMRGLDGFGLCGGAGGGGGGGGGGMRLPSVAAVSGGSAGAGWTSVVIGRRREQ